MKPPLKVLVIKRTALRPFPNLKRVSALAVLAICVLLHWPPKARSASLESLVASNTAFGLSLYGQLATSQGNLFISPYSISTALAMTYAGQRRYRPANGAGLGVWDRSDPIRCDLWRA